QPERDGAAGPPGVFLSRHMPAPRLEFGGDVGLDHLRRFPPVLPREEVVPPRPPARITGDRGEPEIGHLDRGPGPAVAIGERVQLLDEPEAAAGLLRDPGAHPLLHRAVLALQRAGRKGLRAIRCEHAGPPLLNGRDDRHELGAHLLEPLRRHLAAPYLRRPAQTSHAPRSPPLRGYRSEVAAILETCGSTRARATTARPGGCTAGGWRKPRLSSTPRETSTRSSPSSVLPAHRCPPRSRPASSPKATARRWRGPSCGCNANCSSSLPTFPPTPTAAVQAGASSEGDRTTMACTPLRLQRELFVRGADISATPVRRHKLTPGISLHTEAEVSGLEAITDDVVTAHPLRPVFIVPGAT